MSKTASKHPPNQTQTGYYRIGKLAAKLGINRSTIQRAWRDGNLPPYTSECGLPLVRMEDVTAWRSHRVEAEKQRIAKAEAKRMEQGA